VTFTQNVFACAKVATIAAGPPGLIRTAQDSNHDVVDVFTYDATGAALNKQFYLALTC
jgi:hypothetical protein